MDFRRRRKHYEDTQVIEKACNFMAILVRANRLPAYFAFAVLGLWVVTAIVMIFPTTSPMIYIDAGSVYPAKVKAGETMYVTRNFIVTRDDFVTVSRRMVAGDCKVKCEKVNLPTSDMRLAVGEYRNNTVPHVIPFPAKPGKYKLEFSIQWQDRIGRVISMPMPILEVEVIE